MFKHCRRREQCELRHRNVRRPDSPTQNKEMQVALLGWVSAHGGKRLGGLGGRKEGDNRRGKAKETPSHRELECYT